MAEVVDSVDPTQYPAFVPVSCAHGRVRAWASDPVTLDTPPIETCAACEHLLSPEAPAA